MDFHLKLFLIIALFWLPQSQASIPAPTNMASQCDSDITYTPIVSSLNRNALPSYSYIVILTLSDGNLILYFYSDHGELNPQMRGIFVQKLDPNFRIIWTHMESVNFGENASGGYMPYAFEDTTLNSLFFAICHGYNDDNRIAFVQLNSHTGELLWLKFVTASYIGNVGIPSKSAYFKASNGWHYVFLHRPNGVSYYRPLIMYYDPKNPENIYESMNFVTQAGNITNIRGAQLNTNNNIIVTGNYGSGWAMIEVKLTGPDSWKLIRLYEDSTAITDKSYMHGSTGILNYNNKIYSITFNDSLNPYPPKDSATIIPLYQVTSYIGFVFIPSKDFKTYVSQASKTCSGIKLSVFDRATSCFYKSEVDNCAPTNLFFFDNGEASYIANTYYFSGHLHKSQEGGIIFKITFDPILTCLPSQYNYYNQACYDKTTTGCHTICNGSCLTSGNPNIFAGSTQHCLSAKFIDVFIFYSVLPYDDEMEMYGVIYTTDMTILQLTGMSCHPNCGGVCTKPNDPMSCGLWCSADPLVDDTRRFFGYCPCKSSAKMSSNKMQCIAGVQCSSFCDNNECGEDPTDCVRCKTNIPHFIGVPSGNFYYKCQCETDWTLVNNECICTACFEGCEPTKCTSPRDAQKCTKCKSGYRSINQKDGITVYCYKCADNEIDDGNGHCDPGYKADCSPLCNGNCLRQRDKTACFACINRLNLESVISSPVTLKCACKEGTAEFGSNSLCVYQTGCHTYCIEGCTIKNSLHHCASALPNGVCTFNNDNLDYTCSGCNTNTSLTAYGCSKILYANCHSSCTASGCTLANDPTACVECFQDRTLTTNGKTYCGPCQFNDVSLCMQFDGVCWKNYKHPLETADLSSFECASSLAKTCYPIWKQNGESDFQCRDYLKAFNITLLEAIPKALSASHVKASEGANVIIKFDIDVNFQNIQHCSIMLTPETISKLGNSYSCKWLSPKEYSIIYSPINGFLTNLTIRANTVYSSFAYALFAMESVILLVENNGVITFEGILYAPSFVLPSLGLAMTMSVKPICGLNWSYAWHFSYLLGGPQSQVEKKFIADFFYSYGIKSSKTMMVAIPAEVLYKNSILRVAANAFSDLTKNPVVSEAIVIILNELTEQEIFFDLNSKSAITQILTSRKKNQIHIPLLWKNISSYSSENINSLYMTYGKAGNTSVRLEIKSGEKRNQIVTRGEHELILEKKLLQNFIRFRMLNFEVVQKSPNINLFKSYTYYNITMMAQYHLINGNFNNNTDSMIVFFTRQSPVCRITTEWFIINPYIDNDIYSTTSEIDYGYGDEISYLWSCESCQKLSSPFDNCSCDVFHSPGIRRKHITTIKAYALTDLCKYVFSLSITVSNKNFVRSCYTTKEIATINYMNTGLKAFALSGFEGRSSSKSEIYISAEIIYPDMLEEIKSFTWELLEVERKISAQNKFSKRSSFYTRAMKNNIYKNRWLLEINNNTDNSFIPAEYYPKVIDLPQVIPPLLGISKASLPPDTSFTYLLNITYNNSSRKPLYSEANFETSSDPSLRELIISPINGTEYSTKIIFTFVPIANIDPNEEAEYQLFRKDCPNSTNQAEDIYIPFTIRLRNIYSFSSILAGGKIECDYQVGIKLKIYNKERVIETSKTIRVIYLKEKDRKANINSLIEELKDFNYNYNSIAQLITQLYQITSNSFLLSLNELSRLLDILSRYDTEFIDSLSELFTEEEQTSFIELCLQMISNIANSGSKLITEPIFGSLIGKVKNYANMIRNLSSPGISLFPVVVYTLNALANNLKAQRFSKRYAEEIMPIIYLLIETQIKEIIPNARAYQIFYPNINISIKSTSSSYASQVDLNHSLSVNQSVLFPSKLVTNFLSSIPKQTQALITVLVSVSFNPYNEIKQNIIISNASLSNISLAQGKITPEILSAIYNDIRNKSDKYNSIISPTLIYSNILHASLYLTTYSKEEGQKIINISSPIEPLLISQKVLASISLLSPSLLSAENTIILPLYYNNKKKIWTNNQCDIDSNLTLLSSTNSTVLPFNDKNNKNKRNTTYFSSDIKLRCSFINNDTDLDAGHATIILAVDEIPDIDKIERLWQNQGLSQVHNEQAVDVRITAIILGFFFVLMGFVGSGIIIRIEDKSSITVKCQALSARYNKKEASSSSPKKDSSPPIASPRAISPIIASQTSATSDSCLKRLAKFSLDVREKGYANIEPAAQTTLETNPAQRKSSGLTEEASPTERKIVTFKDFPCLFERDISENEEKELMQIYGYLHPSKKQVKITREALIEEINKSTPLHYITTKFIEEKNDIFKGSISGLIITEFPWLSLILINSMLSYRAARLITLCCVYLGELFIIGCFFKGSDSIYISEDCNDFIQIAFKAIATAIISMIGLKLLCQFFLVAKYPYHYSEKANAYSNNKRRCIIGILFLLVWVIICLWRIIYCSLKYERIALEKWLWAYFICFGIEILLVDAIKIGLKLMINYILMKMAQRTSMQCLHKAFIIRALSAIYYYFP